MSTVMQKHPIMTMPRLQRQAFMLLANGLFKPLVWSLDNLGLYEGLQRRLNKNFPLANLYRPSFSSYEAHPSDIFVCTYPKSGTNWMLQIAFQLSYLGQGEYEHIHDVVPWPDGESLPAVPLENWSIAQASPTGKRVIKTHLAWDALPYHPEARYITIIRDPKDVFVSSYHFVKDVALGALMPSPQTWYKLFIEGPFMLGSWAEHVASYWAQRDKPNHLILSYENMKKDSMGMIRQVSKFLEIAASEEVLEAVHQMSDFRYMQQIDHKFHPGAALPFSPASGLMMRKGEAKRAADLLSPAQQAEIDKVMQSELERLNSDFPYAEWYCN